jgi:hypothetical protein
LDFGRLFLEATRVTRPMVAPAKTTGSSTPAGVRRLWRLTWTRAPSDGCSRPGALDFIGTLMWRHGLVERKATVLLCSLTCYCVARIRNPPVRTAPWAASRRLESSGGQAVAGARLNRAPGIRAQTRSASRTVALIAIWRNVSDLFGVVRVMPVR